MDKVQENDGWIDINASRPDRYGWCQIKTMHGEHEAPFVHNGKGDLVWLLPDPSIVTHWKEKK